MRRELLLVLIFLAVLTCIIFWKALIQNLFPFPGDYLLAWYEPWKTDYFINNVITIAHKAVADDIFRHLYPLRLLTVDIMKNLQWPLWNPYNGAGMPLLAIMHPGYFNPFGLIFFFSKPESAWLIFLAFQPIVLGFFTYIYCRKINLTPLSASISSVSLLFSGFIIVRLEFGEFLYVLSGLPLLLWIIETRCSNKLSNSMWLLPLIILFIFLSGQPQMILYVLMFAWFYAACRFFQNESDKKFAAKNLLIYSFFCVFGIGLSSFQLIPSFELYRFSTINQVSSQFIFNRFFVPLNHLLSVFIPNFFGNQATYNYWGSGDYIETVVSIGLIPCFFVLMAIYSRPKNHNHLISFFVAATIISILLAVKWYGSRLFYALGIPVLSVDVPSRIFVLTTFSLSILAGIGFNSWITSKKKFTFTLIKSYLLFILLILFTLTVLIFLKFPCRIDIVTNCYLVALRNTILETVIFCLFTAVFFLKFNCNLLRIKKIFPIATLFLIIISGLYNSNKFLPFSRKETILPVNNVLSILQEKTRNARIFGLGKANLKTNLATHFRIFDPNYYDPLHGKRYSELIYYANTAVLPAVLPRSDVEIDAEVTPSAEITSRRDRLFNLLSVQYLLYKKEELNNIINNNINTVWEDENWILFRRNQSMPRVYFANNYEVIIDNNLILKRLFDPAFDPRNSVVLEKNPTIFHSTLNKINRNEEISLVKYMENEVLITATTNTSSLLVLSDNYYSGWNVYIDDIKGEIYRANYSLRAVVVPPGNHSIRFIYESLSLRIGLTISIFSFLIYLFSLFLLLIYRASISSSFKIFRRSL